jgi:hypothetical protein
MTLVNPNQRPRSRTSHSESNVRQRTQAKNMLPTNEMLPFLCEAVRMNAGQPVHLLAWPPPDQQHTTSGKKQRHPWQLSMRLSRPPDKSNTQPQRRQVNATHWMQVNDLDSHSARREAVTLSSRFFTLLEIRINQGNSQKGRNRGRGRLSTRFVFTQHMIRAASDIVSLLPSETPSTPGQSHVASLWYRQSLRLQDHVSV